MRHPLGLLAACLLLCPVTAHAHDYWLAPRDYNPAVDQSVTIDLFVGDHLVPQGSRPHDPSKAESFVQRHRCSTEDLNAGLAAGADPIIEDAFERDGLVLLGLERQWVDITLADEKFGHYLAHEELTEMQAVRQQRGPQAQENERYTRSIKSLLRVGDRSRGKLHRKALGHRMELVLLDDPYRMEIGDPLRVKVLFEGQRLPGVTVSVLQARDTGLVTARAPTDSKGIATFMLDRPGPWLARLVHMQSCDGQRDAEACATADWRSYWASFSFAIPA